MKRILQAMDGVATQPVVGANDMSKFLSIIDKNNVKIIKEEVNNSVNLNEGANPHKVSLPVQMAMQHYAEPAKAAAPKTPSLLKQYFAEAEEQQAQELAAKQEKLKMYSQKIASRVLESSLQVAQPAARDEKTIQQEIKVLNKELAKAEYAFAKSREITKEIKYDDTASSILLRIRELAQSGINIDQSDLKYAEQEVFDKVKELESAVYGLEQAFEDAVRNTKIKVEELESEIDEIHDNRRFGRPGV